MTCEVRIQFARAFDHAMTRGDRREPIVRYVSDCATFAELLEEFVKRAGFEISAWVLMTKHPAFVYDCGEYATICFPILFQPPDPAVAHRTVMPRGEQMQG